MSEQSPTRRWSFVTNHAEVLACLVEHAQYGQLTERQIAARIGVTERTTQKIIADLVAGGFVRRTRVGRCNHYEVVMLPDILAATVASRESISSGAST